MCNVHDPQITQIAPIEATDAQSTAAERVIKKVQKTQKRNAPTGRKTMSACLIVDALD